MYEWGSPVASGILQPARVHGDLAHVTTTRGGEFTRGGGEKRAQHDEIKSKIRRRAFPPDSRDETPFGYRGEDRMTGPSDLTLADATLSCLTPAAEWSDTSETAQAFRTSLWPGKRPRVIGIPVQWCTLMGSDGIKISSPHG